MGIDFRDTWIRSTAGIFAVQAKRARSYTVIMALAVRQNDTVKSKEMVRAKGPVSHSMIRYTKT